MRLSQESLSTWATVVGTIVSILALIQSRAWLVMTSLLFVCISVAAGAYARKERLAVTSASITVEGHSIDSLNVANIRRRINRSLVIQEAHHVARIEHEDLMMTWRYAGYCRAERETNIEFSIDSDNSVPFDRLDCFAYDLRRDPGMRHKIRPVLIGSEGISKKIAVPFLTPLAAEEAFEVLLKCTLPGCIKPGCGYYTSTLSFDQDRVRHWTVRLLFVGGRPNWVRAYDCDAAGDTTLLKALRPVRQNGESAEYLDTDENVTGQATRLYLFWRTADLKTTQSFF